MTHSWEKRRTDCLTEVWQFKQSSLRFVAGIELVPESLLIFKPGLFTLFSFLKGVWEEFESHADLSLFFS